MKIFLALFLSGATTVAAFLYPLFWDWYCKFNTDPENRALPLTFSLLFWFAITGYNLLCWIRVYQTTLKKNHDD